jgi:hypothetical protein
MNLHSAAVAALPRVCAPRDRKPSMPDVPPRGGKGRCRTEQQHGRARDALDRVASRPHRKPIYSRRSAAVGCVRLSAAGRTRCAAARASRECPRLNSATPTGAWDGACRSCRRTGARTHSRARRPSPAAHRLFPPGNLLPPGNLFRALCSGRDGRTQCAIRSAPCTPRGTRAATAGDLSEKGTRHTRR